MLLYSFLVPVRGITCLVCTNLGALIFAVPNITTSVTFVLPIIPFSFNTHEINHSKLRYIVIHTIGDNYMYRKQLYNNMKTQTQQQEITTYASEIFEQLKASKIHGFPFFAYTGIKVSEFSDESLYLKLPKNPSEFKSILVTYDIGSDTYIVSFYTDDVPLKSKDRHEDIYFDQLAELIVRETGVY